MQLPEQIRFTVPGFISDQFYALDPRRFRIRTVFIPESFFVGLEQEVIGAEGDAGKAKLYGIGKRYGYRLAMLNRFPKGNVHQITLSSIYSFFEMAYARKMSTPMLNISGKTICIESDDLIIVRKNSTGYLDPVGCWSGIWAYLNDDYSLEACLERSGASSTMVSGPRKTLRDTGLEPIECDVLPKKVDFMRYTENNRAQDVSAGSVASFTRLCENGFVYYRPGSVILKGPDERIIPSEASKLYEIEAGISPEIIYDAAYGAFHRIGSSIITEEPAEKLLCDLLSGLGFGIVRAEDSRERTMIILQCYPWFTDEHESTNFAYIRGAVTGFLNGAGTSCKAGTASARHVGDTFTVTITVAAKGQ